MTLVDYNTTLVDLSVDYNNKTMVVKLFNEKVCQVFRAWARRVNCVGSTLQ